MRRGSLAVAAVLFLFGGIAAAAPIVNGDFETGTFAGWTVSAQPGSGGDFFLLASGGNSYAQTDMEGPGAYALIQSFTVPAGVPQVVLTFQMFANDWSGSGGIVNPAGIDYEAEPNQHVRVDILTAGASPFDTSLGVLSNLYLGVDGPEPPYPFSDYSFDITPVVSGGGTFQLRFAGVDNQEVLNLGVDNVDIAFTPIPEPTTLALFGLGLAGLVAWRRKRRKAA